MKLANPRTSWRGRAFIAVALAGVLALAGVALAATNAHSTFTFKLNPSTLPKTTYKSASLLSNLVTGYAEPGNDHVTARSSGPDLSGQELEDQPEGRAEVRRQPSSRARP